VVCDVNPLMGYTWPYNSESPKYWEHIPLLGINDTNYLCLLYSEKTFLFVCLIFSPLFSWIHSFVHFIEKKKDTFIKYFGVYVNNRVWIAYKWYAFSSCSWICSQKSWFEIINFPGLLWWFKELLFF